MTIAAHGIPWDQETYKRIERKGGCHYKSTASDYIDLERRIEAHELRYADRVEVYGEGRFNGMRITDCVVVLNGGVYMSTGIKAPDEPITVRQGEHDGPTEQERYDSVSVTGSGRQVEDDADPPAGIDPELPIDYDLCKRLGLTTEECEEWRPGGGWSDPKPIDPKQLQQTSIFFATRAEYHRRMANRWRAAMVASIVLAVAVLLIPTGWIWAVFEAFRQ
ncbi:MAG: hypothetical protein KAI86_02990 [Desulfobacterales bacterium]|nr:hypothetical protein [Desulfobacterales bacterium]